MLVCPIMRRVYFPKRDLCLCQQKTNWPYSKSPCYSLLFQQTKSLAPLTPLTGRRYLKDKDPSITPVSTATQSVSKLQLLLSGRKTSPSDVLLDMFRFVVFTITQFLTFSINDLYRPLTMLCFLHTIDIFYYNFYKQCSNVFVHFPILELEYFYYLLGYILW